MLILLNYKEFGCPLPKTLFSGLDSCGSAYSSQLTQIQQWAHAESEIQHLALNVLALRGDTVLNELPEFSNPPSAKYGNRANEELHSAQGIQNQLSLFPNPSDGWLTLEMEHEVEKLSVGVFDLTGRNVFEHTWRNKSKTQSIFLQHLSNGVYYIQVRSGNQLIGVKPVVINP